MGIISLSFRRMLFHDIYDVNMYMSIHIHMLLGNDNHFVKSGRVTFLFLIGRVAAPVSEQFTIFEERTSCKKYFQLIKKYNVNFF